MSAVKSRTPNLGLGRLNFNFPNWGDDANKNTDIIDTAFAVFGYTIRGNWLNDTEYFTGDLVADVDESKLYRALVNHTSSLTGTFSQDRVAVPLRWEAVETTISSVGNWQAATVYSTNQFLVDGARYGVTTNNFTSGVSYNADVTDGKIITLIDLTNYGTLAGFNDPPTAGKVILGNGTIWTSGDISTLAFPTGTRAPFNQTAAPTFWTKDTTHNNKALRIVNGTVGSGGTVGFTTAFASKSVVGSNSSIALTDAQIQAHAHSVDIWANVANVDHAHYVNLNSGFVSADHVHGFFASSGSGSANHDHGGVFVARQSGLGIGQEGDGSGWAQLQLPQDGASHFHNISGTTGGISANHYHNAQGWSGGFNTNHQHAVNGVSGVVGGSQTHTHIFSGTPIDLAVQYVDFIIAIKD